jgi:ribosome-associated protein
MPRKEIEIKTDLIRLDSLLKYTGCAGTGGEAKLRIQNGEISVNGHPCCQRTHKLRDGDIVTVDGSEYVVRGAGK